MRKRMQFSNLKIIRNKTLIAANIEFIDLNSTMSNAMIAIDFQSFLQIIQIIPQMQNE